MASLAIPKTTKHKQRNTPCTFGARTKEIRPVGAWVELAIDETEYILDPRVFAFILLINVLSLKNKFQQVYKPYHLGNFRNKPLLRKKKLDPSLLKSMLGYETFKRKLNNASIN